MKCPICGGGHLFQQEEDVDIQYHGLTCKIHDVVSFVCDVCDDGFYRKDFEKKIESTFSEFKNLVDVVVELAVKKEIKHDRKKEV